MLFVLFDNLPAGQFFLFYRRKFYPFLVELSGVFKQIGVIAGEFLIFSELLLVDFLSFIFSGLNVLFPTECGQWELGMMSNSLSGPLFMHFNFEHVFPIPFLTPANDHPVIGLNDSVFIDET